MPIKRPVGRPPAENPKSVKLTVRVDAEEAEILDAYCERAHVSRADGVREGIRGLRNKK